MKCKKQLEWFELGVTYSKLELEVLKKTQEIVIEFVMMIVADFYKIYQNFREYKECSHIGILSQRIYYYTTLSHTQIGF